MSIFSRPYSSRPSHHHWCSYVSLTAEWKSQILRVLPESSSFIIDTTFFFSPHFDSIDSVLLFGRACLALHRGKNYYQTIPAKTCDLIQQQNFSAKCKLNNSFLHSPQVFHRRLQTRLNPKWKRFEN